MASSQHQARVLRSAAAAALLAFSLPALAQTAGGRIDVRAQTIAHFDFREPERVRFGMLEFRGGLILTSTSRQFGSLSALRVAPDGAQFIAVSDRGFWLRARIVYGGSRPTGIVDAEMAPLLDANGRRLSARGWYDSEALADDGGTFYVGLERVHRIVKFDLGKDGLRARAAPVPVPPGFATLPYNKSVEALVMVPKGLPLAGSLIAISESGLDAGGNIRAFIVGGTTPGEFSLKQTENFDVSDAALLPGGDLLVLERRASWLRGIAARIRRISLAAIKPGALADGPVIFSADLAQQIDNLEGIAVHRTPMGETVLTLISDDNFSALQRTLLLQFTLVGE